VAEIQDPNYETVTAQCDHCGAMCVFSRVDDLATVGPVSGERVACSSCGESFCITADTVNTPYQFLIDEARKHFKAKRYMPTIATLAQAWEMFFAEFAWGRYVYAPFFAADRYDRDVDELNSLSKQLTLITAKFTFAPMRNLLIHTVVRQIRPVTTAEAAIAIQQIKDQSFGNDPPSDFLDQVADEKIREVLGQVRDITVGELRNQVIHKHAYRPRRVQVEPCVTAEVKVLYRLKHRLGVMDFMEHQMHAA
jgi:hypothetical protein